MAAAAAILAGAGLAVPSAPAGGDEADDATLSLPAIGLAAAAGWDTRLDEDPPLGLPEHLFPAPGNFTIRRLALPAFAAPESDAPESRDEQGLPDQAGDTRIAEENAASYGSLATPPYLQLVLTRAEDTPRATFFRDMARRAADTGAAIRRLSRVSTLPTRFGGFETAAAVLDDGHSAASACQLFRFHQADLEFGLAGWLCDREPDEDRAGRMTCLLDRITLSPRVSDLPLRVAFAEAGAANIPPACVGTPFEAEAVDVVSAPVPAEARLVAAVGSRVRAKHRRHGRRRVRLSRP